MRKTEKVKTKKTWRTSEDRVSVRKLTATKLFNPDKPIRIVGFDFEGHRIDATGVAWNEGLNSIVVESNELPPVVPNNRINVSKRNIKQNSHWCFPEIRKRPINLSSSRWGERSGGYR